VNDGSNTVSVIDTATNTVAATVPVGIGPAGLAVTPDGKHVYVGIYGASYGLSVGSVIDTATNTLEAATLAVGNGPRGVAVTPDGKHAYVANIGADTVSVIDTATNTVEAAALAVGSVPDGVAVTPDGTHAYVANYGSNCVSVIDTATNTVEAAALAVGSFPIGVGIMPAPTIVPFLAFNALLAIPPSLNAFQLESSFTLSSTAPAIDPVTQAVAFQVGTFTTTIPAGSFKNIGGKFPFVGVIGGVTLQVLIVPTGTLRYGFFAGVAGASLAGTTSPVPVALKIGADTGTTSVTGLIFH
jgi:YVTN family beta-propeller protein